jgi:hypothetical protein
MLALEAQLRALTVSSRTAALPQTESTVSRDRAKTAFSASTDFATLEKKSSAHGDVLKHSEPRESSREPLDLSNCSADDVNAAEVSARQRVHDLASASIACLQQQQRTVVHGLAPSHIYAAEECSFGRIARQFHAELAVALEVHQRYEFDRKAALMKRAVRQVASLEADETALRDRLAGAEHFCRSELRTQMSVAAMAIQEAQEMYRLRREAQLLVAVDHLVADEQNGREHLKLDELRDRAAILRWEEHASQWRVVLARSQHLLSMEERHGRRHIADAELTDSMGLELQSAHLLDLAMRQRLNERFLREDSAARRPTAFPPTVSSPMRQCSTKARERPSPPSSARKAAEGAPREQRLHASPTESSIRRSAAKQQSPARSSSRRPLTASPERGQESARRQLYSSKSPGASHQRDRAADASLAEVTAIASTPILNDLKNEPQSGSSNPTGAPTGENIQDEDEEEEERLPTRPPLSHRRRPPSHGRIDISGEETEIIGDEAAQQVSNPRPRQPVDVSMLSRPTASSSGKMRQVHSPVRSASSVVVRNDQRVSQMTLPRHNRQSTATFSSTPRPSSFRNPTTSSQRKQVFAADVQAQPVVVTGALSSPGPAGARSASTTSNLSQRDHASNRSRNQQMGHQSYVDAFYRQSNETRTEITSRAFGRQSGSSPIRDIGDLPLSKFRRHAGDLLDPSFVVVNTTSEDEDGRVQRSGARRKPRAAAETSTAGAVSATTVGGGPQTSRRLGSSRSSAWRHQTPPLSPAHTPPSSLLDLSTDKGPAGGGSDQRHGRILSNEASGTAWEQYVVQEVYPSAEQTVRKKKTR